MQTALCKHIVRQVNKEGLRAVLDLHRKWLVNEDGGVRANLGGADLHRANLGVANLRGADLSEANLSVANLRGADLSGADLSEANLSVANLRGADLSGADLSGADLSGADLHRANLGGSDLSVANLHRANLGEADLSGADLHRANLGGANLSTIKEDFFEVLKIASHEVLGLHDALMRGRIDGSEYEGKCACLVGTIANVRHEKYEELSIDLKPNSDRASEKWFLAIRLGDTPQSNPVADITATWMREWMDAHGVKYPRYEIVAIGEVKP